MTSISGRARLVFDVMTAAEVVEEALARAGALMAHDRYEILAAEEVLSQAVASLRARMQQHAVDVHDLPRSTWQKQSDAQFGGDGNEGDEDKSIQEHLLRMCASTTFRSVYERVAQFDASVAILHNTGFSTVFRREVRDSGLVRSPVVRVPDDVDIDAPLTECVSTGHEVDLLPQAQPLVNTASMLGTPFGYNFVSMMRLGFPFIQPEVLIEVIRHRDYEFGYLMEVVRSEFSCEGFELPAKGWGVIRPWVYNTNLWIPRGGGQAGTTIVQVSIIDCTMSVPSWFLNVLISKMSTAFINDLRSSAKKAMQPESPWANRIEEDAAGFYSELRNIEAAAATRREVRVNSVPDHELFHRPWRLRPPPIDLGHRRPVGPGSGDEYSLSSRLRPFLLQRGEPREADPPVAFA
eukprot:CAMPEP_0176111718 /NCGR_PEP_ID=MMETSP0120_2-20121206/56101_1 /TAXON_ID=160619 /ORGANISM="Kryptoperidinium foliaceum, Strain CCMP 1326" /LENGTH=406 /DNA_ID=CAMNT_0017445935 /DNA_START=148 /DNA_END=1367 /DNA_ORIENTATION=-